ncbi:MAG TPA: hypothetical protein VMJ32_13025 [Pirellulales bacterium]|nr:hypothetical protein [Pirellulales bacterium]
MTRLPLALVGFLSALMATIASAQSYPQPYPMYGTGPNPQAAYAPGSMSQAGYAQPMMPPAAYAQPGMPPGTYGYGYGPNTGGGYPVLPAGYNYGAMPAGGMYPSLPGNGMYSGTGYNAGYTNAGSGQGYAGAYGPNAMSQGMYPPAGQNHSGMSGGANQASNPTQSAPQDKEYHGPQGQIAKASPPPMKLPPGVTCENGLLYYKGSAHADVNYQQFPMGTASNNPYRMASYQAGAENGMGSPSSVLTPGSNPQGAGMPMGNGGAGTQDASQGNGQCQCDGDQCQDCGPGCFGWLCGLCHGSMFPGKLGYCWNAGYDNLAMTRNAGTSRTLVLFDNFDGTFTPLLNSRDVTFDWDYGGRAHLELIGPSGITYQGTYTKIATFAAQQSVGSPNSGNADLVLPGELGGFSSAFPAGFFDVDAVTFRYLSAIQTGEFNLIFPFGSFEILAGYRYMEIDEHAQYLTNSLATGNGFYDANSLNNMNGGQIGILGRWQMFGLLDFDFDAKFGVMANAAHENQIAFDPVDQFIGPASGSKTRVAYVTELGIQGVIPLGSSVSFHAGYNVYFIDRAALAPDQYDFNSFGLTSDGGTQVNNHGDIVLQGINTGITVVW